MADGWWNLDGAITSCVAAYQAIGAASYAASKVNLFNPGTLDAVDGTAYPTWAAETGWTHNGTSQYLDSGILATEAMSVFIRFDNATTPANGYPTIFGNAEANKCLYIHPRSTDGNRYYIHGSDSYPVTLSGALASGVIGIAGYSVYENGSDTNQDTQSFITGAGTNSIFIGCRREANTLAGYFFAGNITAMSFYSGTLTAGEVADLTAAMNALSAGEPDALTAQDLTLASVTFDAPTLTNVTGITNLVATDFTLAHPTFDAPTLTNVWVTPACRTYTVAAESRSFVVGSESRGLKILCNSEVTYQIAGLTYNGLTAKDFTLARLTFDAPADMLSLRQKYVEQNFGAFVHYNMATFCDGDSANADWNVNLFSPTGLDIDQWLDAFVSAGMKYATLTVKHHDGFALWPTAYAAPAHDPYSIAETTWYANNGSPDIVGLFVAKCRTHGLNPCLYFSMWDTTYEARSGSDESTGAAAYIAMIKMQLTELLTNYGAITAIWTDGWAWHLGYEEITYADIYAHIKSIQPSCLLVENSHVHPSQTSEIDQYEIAFDGIPAEGNIVLSECCGTIRNDGTWFYNNNHDQTSAALQTSATILSTIATLNSRNATYLLNFTPDWTGHLPAAQVTILGEIGA